MLDRYWKLFKKLGFQLICCFSCMGSSSVWLIMYIMLLTLFYDTILYAYEIWRRSVQIVLSNSAVVGV